MLQKKKDKNIIRNCDLKKKNKLKNMFDFVGQIEENSFSVDYWPADRESWERFMNI